MNSIPIFDSLTHPTIDGDWILPKYPQKSKIDVLLEEMKKYNIIKALAVGMQTIGKYSENEYVDFILSKTDKLIPIAFFNINEFRTINQVVVKLDHLKKIGYRGIKLHPRIGQFNLTNELLPEVINYASKIELPTLLCTYFYDNKIGSFLNNTTNLISLLEKTSDAKIILLHGGTVKLLEYMEIARAFQNIILDISLTMNKYEGSSIDQDIHFLFKKFDRRICLGTDHPEFSYSKLRERFNFFAKGVEVEKLRNIAYQNISNIFQYKYQVEK